MRLLIVDDNPNFRYLLRRFLSGREIDFHECNDGAEAVAAYERYRPDWVLMDIEMPEMDGLTATMRILAVDPRARVVILTQHDDANWRDAAGKAGARDFVAKENLFVLREVLDLD